MKVEGELNKICERLLTLLDTHMLQGDVSDNPEQVEGRVFYQKMKGDYYRYMAEYSSGNDKSEHETNAATAYQQAVDKAADLAPTHPIRLGLALNFSVFYVRDAAGGRVFAHVPVPFSCLLPYRVPRPALLKEPL